MSKITNKGWYNNINCEKENVNFLCRNMIEGNYNILDNLIWKISNNMKKKLLKEKKSRVYKKVFLVLNVHILILNQYRLHTYINFSIMIYGKIIILQCFLIILMARLYYCGFSQLFQWDNYNTVVSLNYLKFLNKFNGFVD